MKWIHLFRNGIDRYSSGDVDGWHYQLDARGEPAGKWGGFACQEGGLYGLLVPHKFDDLESARAQLNALLREKGEAVSYDGATNMTVAQLIEALQRMPPDAPILTHANNHSTGLGSNNDQRVALTLCSGRPAVIIGNWDEYNVNGWGPEKVPREVWAVQTWGPRAGLLVRGSMKLREETTRAHTRRETIPAHWEFTDESK